MCAGVDAGKIKVICFCLHYTLLCFTPASESATRVDLQLLQRASEPLANNPRLSFDPPPPHRSSSLPQFSSLLPLRRSFSNQVRISLLGGDASRVRQGRVWTPSRPLNCLLPFCRGDGMEERERLQWRRRLLNDRNKRWYYLITVVSVA